MGAKAIGMEAMFTATEVLSATGGRLLRGNPGQGIPGIATDSRTIRLGELFVAIKGDRFDGHQFIYDAMLRGGIGAVVNVSDHRMPETVQEEELLRDRMLIGVSDTLTAYQDLARFHRKRWALPIVAITGSNGKTTTKEMAAAILSERYVTMKSEGNINNQIGVPMTLLKLDERYQAAVLEMGISRPGELRRLSDLAKPQVALITNIGPTHLEMLGNVKEVAQAKSELLEGLDPDQGVAVLNRDDAFYTFLRARTRASVVTFGADPEADVVLGDLEESGSDVWIQLTFRPSAIRLGPEGSAVRPATGRPSRIRVRLQIPGRHNALNAAAAAAVARVLGCSSEEVRRGLEKFRPVTMRSEVISWEGRVILNDAYNANPASMRAAIETLEHYPGSGRRMAVLGDMRELGIESREAHRQIGRVVVSSGVDFLMTVGSEAGVIAEEALASGMDPKQVRVCRELSEAAKLLERLTADGDVVLIKGSRGMKMERIIDQLRRGR